MLSFYCVYMKGSFRRAKAVVREMTKHEKLAAELFESGYNCAQAVFCAFSDLTGMDIATSARFASAFGGGMGRMREVCGAVSGMFMVLGVLYGYSEPEDNDGKKALYKNVQALAEKMKELHGSIICHELLGEKRGESGYLPADRTPEYYNARPCTRLCMDAAAFLDEFMEANK